MRGVAKQGRAVLKGEMSSFFHAVFLWQIALESITGVCYALGMAKDGSGR